MRRNIFTNTFYVLFVLIITGCGKSLKTSEDVLSNQVDLIQVTQKQFETENMKIGEVTLQFFEEEINCNGYISSPPNGMAQISTYLSGIVESVECSTGDYVHKGQTLCMISGNELIDIQQEYAETAAILKRLQTDFERSKVLFDEKIGSEKDYIASESEYKAIRAKYNALQMRLQLLKLDVLKIEAGEIYSSFPVTTPISGYITSLDMVLGQYTEEQKPLAEIIDVNQLQLKLSVFENDINKLKPGQSIRFNSLGESPLVHNANLISIGKTIDPVSKTIQCIARIKNEPGTMYINSSYVEATIIADRTELDALPNEAILKLNSENYVFAVEKSDNQNFFLRKVKVRIGRVSNEFSEILDAEGLGNVIIKGVFNLQ
jgi:cobalt-zinc-cadmium efflux system membrane fusion protein